MSEIVGVDLGGTKILAALVDVNGRASGHVKAETPTGGPDEVVAAIIELVREVTTSPTAVGLGAPGPVSDGVLLHGPNLKGFDRPVPLGALIGDALGAPVILGNDATVGTLGEAHHGAARDSQDVLGCWMGTGIGGGLVLGGKAHVGAHGAAGELGHVPVVMDSGRGCGCGRTGCLEAYAGRASMARAVREAIADGEDTILPDVMVEKGKDRFTSGVWKTALKKGDPLAHRIMDTAVAALGVALAGMLNVLDVETLVFGGGMAEKLGDAHVQRIADATTPHLIAPDLPRRWVVAELGDDSGVVGAAEMARTATGQ